MYQIIPFSALTTRLLYVVTASWAETVVGLSEEPQEAELRPPWPNPHAVEANMGWAHH